MPVPFRLDLTPAQRTELVAARDHAPKPHVREKAAAVLKVADGASLRAVARDGLLRPRRVETVARWVHAYRAGGVASFAIRPGRGRQPAFSPPVPGRRS
jgi:transposase